MRSRLDEAAFQSELQGEDVLGVVVRAHIRIELCLNDLIEALVADPQHVAKMNLEFAQQIHLAVSLGLQAPYAPSLLAMGSLRNQFAHRANAQLGKQEINNLFKSLPEDVRTVVGQSYERTKNQLGQNARPSFRQLPPRDQLVFIAIGLRAALEFAIGAAGRRSSSA